MNKQSIVMLVSCFAMGKVFLETPVQASVVQGLKNMFTSDTTKVKNRMKRAADEIGFRLKSLAGIFFVKKFT
jgi:hypothetical protein